MKRETPTENLFTIIKKLENELRQALEKKREIEFPLADIVESEAEYTVFIDLPGADKNKIILNAADNYLDLSVDIQSPDFGPVRYLLRERPQGSIKRRFTFPEKIDVNSIKAKYSGNNGVLEIHIPKKGTSEKLDKVD
ncbi:MAG: Hsp20/alpha crystallin family protein [Candidatus Freyarchaeota archaeon]|nr:Hsp20/alpha crystallin family protein [Candidatus Jordarchaeia archaeon]MBS7269025.1 Hsp20/alpha crystallin family protein [Candidatus Jordarchaeia archaeon]